MAKALDCDLKVTFLGKRVNSLIPLLPAIG